MLIFNIIITLTYKCPKDLVARSHLFAPQFYLTTIFCAYRAFSHDITPTTLVSDNNKMAAMSVWIEMLSSVNLHNC